MYPNNYTYLRLEMIKYLSFINTIHEETRKIWLKPIHTYYTDHGIPHSERILRLCDKMLEYHYGQKLCEEEIVILAASCYLHDIGMQLPEFSGLEKKETYSNAEKNHIRDNHHIASANAIKIILVEKTDIDRGLIEYISLISKYHREKGCNIYNLEDSSFHGKNIRLRLLACIMRLGDELDVDSQRIDFSSAEFIGLLPLTKMHWYSHKYIESLSFNDGRITVFLRVPIYPKNPDAIKLLVAQFINNIQKRLNGVYKVMYQNKLFVYPRVSVNSINSGIMDDIPDDVIDYLLDNKKNITFKYRTEKKSLVKPMPLLNDNYQVIGSHIYLSVGKRFEVGCLDSQFSDNHLTSSELIFLRPDYILRAVNPYTEMVTIHVNRYPNIDCFIGIYLIQKLIIEGRLDEFDYKFSLYCIKSIKGETKAIIDGHYSFNMYIYTIMHMFDDHINNMVENALILLNTVDTIIRNNGYELDSPEFLEELEKSNKIKKLKEALDNDYNEFIDNTVNEKRIRHLPARRVPCEQIDIFLPLQNDDDTMKIGKTKGFMWYDVPDCELHWLWPKSDDVLTFVPTTLNEKSDYKNKQFKISKYYFSLRGDSIYSLSKLVELLRKAEADIRKEILGELDYSFSLRGTDLWNNPQRHKNTIVVSPRKGSLLTVVEVIDVFNKYLQEIV